MKVDLEIVLKAINDEPEIPENISKKFYDNSIAIYAELLNMKKETKLGIKNRLLDLIGVQKNIKNKRGK